MREVKDDVDNHTAFDKEAQRAIITPEWRDLYSALVALDRSGRNVHIRRLSYVFRWWKAPCWRQMAPWRAKIHMPTCSACMSTMQRIFPV